MQKHSAIEFENLTRCYGQKRAVDRIGLTVPEATIFGFLGPNGAGKTTTIRVLMGLLKPTEGRATIFGKDCWTATREIKKSVGYICGDLNLYPWLRGHEALRLLSLSRQTDLRREGSRLAKYFDLDLSVKVRRMSRGMKQKLGLIMAMAHEPKLLVLDEPSTALDPLVQERLRSLLREKADQGATIFFSSHSLSEVEQLCDHVSIIREGKIVADQSLDKLRQQAGYQLTIRWKTGTDVNIPDLPDFFDLQEQNDPEWVCLTTAPISKIIHWLDGKPIDDLAIIRPDLETVFRRYYIGEKR